MFLKVEINVFAKKNKKIHFFYKNIWSCQKKAVPLHPISKGITT